MYAGCNSAIMERRKGGDGGKRMDKIKIVIADDNSFIREGLKIILSSYEEVCVKFFSIRFKYRDSKTLFLYTFV